MKNSNLYINVQPIYIDEKPTMQKIIFNILQYIIDFLAVALVFVICYFAIIFASIA